MARKGTGRDRGAGLIILIIVLAFLLTVGILLLYVTGTGPEVAGNVRLQERAFDAAEAGFDAVWRMLNENIIGGAMQNFGGQYRTDYAGLLGVFDDPKLSDDITPNPNYFRNLTDEEILADIATDPTNVLLNNQPLPNDNSLTYTVFLIDDEASGMAANDRDCIVVCIGRAGLNTYARIEVVIEIQTT